VNGEKHLVTGLVAGAAYAGVAGQPLLLVPPCALIAGFASLAPDLDLENAMLSTRLPWLSWIVRRFSFGHRGLTHLVPLWVGLAIVSAVLARTAASRLGLPWLVWLPTPVTAFWVGYLCHLAQDAMTKEGIPMIPLKWTNWHITPCTWMRFPSDSFRATLVTGVMVTGCVGVVALAYVPGALPWFDAGIRTVAGAH